jgi:hypothetical protein
MAAIEPPGAPPPEDDVPALDADEPGGFPLVDDDDPQLPNDGGTTRVLTGLLRLSPFLALDDRAGGDHPKRRAFCFGLDLTFRLMVALLLLAVIAGIAWKTLAPFPSL